MEHDAWIAPDAHAGHVRARPLPDDQCLALLGRVEVARVAWCTIRGPVVVPVNIRLMGRRIVIRTSGASALAERVDAERVAVQADAVDAMRRRGWSVLARGTAQVRFGPMTDDDPVPWPAGPHSAVVIVPIDELSGRWLPSRDGEPGPSALG